MRSSVLGSFCCPLFRECNFVILGFSCHVISGVFRAVYGASSGLVQQKADRLLRPGDLELGHDLPGLVEQLLGAPALSDPPRDWGIILDAGVVLSHSRLFPSRISRTGTLSIVTVRTIGHTVNESVTKSKQYLHASYF